MNLLELFFLLLIAGVTGSLGRSLTGNSRGGCIVSIIFGFIGAMLGKYFSQKLELPELWNLHAGGMEFPVIWSIIGAAVFSGIVNLLSVKKRL